MLRKYILFLGQKCLRFVEVNDFYLETVELGLFQHKEEVSDPLLDDLK